MSNDPLPLLNTLRGSRNPAVGALALVFVAASLFARTGDAAPATCTFPPVYPPSVGDTASDSNCDFDTIQAAIDAQVCPATIAITREHIYNNQHLSIQNKSITLVGLGDGVACPGPILNGGNGGGTKRVAATPNAPVVTINGGGSGGRVLSIGGSSHVTLKYIEITGGSLASNPSGDGGGIGFEGSGSLTLDTSTVDANRADYGGGINFKGTGDPDTDAPATLTLGHNAQIINNSADISGGGVRVEGNARMFSLDTGATIALNHASGGYGGGLEVIAPAMADIGGYGLFPVVFDNDAQYGGGVAVINDLGNTSEKAQLRLFATNEQNPVRVSGNSASHAGGGIYVRGAGAGLSAGPAFVCGWGARIDGNSAAEGAAIYADTSSAYVTLANNYAFGPGACSSPETVTALGAVACTPGVPCNTINDNVDLDGNGNSTNASGAAVLIQSDNGFGLFGVRLQGNTGAHVVRVLDRSGFDLHDCLVTGNDVGSNLVQLEGADVQVGQPIATIYGCTVDDNQLHGNSLLESSHDIDLRTSILGDFIQTATMDGGAVLYDGSILAADTAGLTGPNVVQGYATYVDAGDGDYHLTPTSTGVDFASTGGGVDLDGRARDVDLATIGNINGPRDLGAFERQSAFLCDDNADALFCAGFDGP